MICDLIADLQSTDWIGMLQTPPQHAGKSPSLRFSAVALGFNCP